MNTVDNRELAKTFVLSGDIELAKNLLIASGNMTGQEADDFVGNLLSPAPVSIAPSRFQSIARAAILRGETRVLPIKVGGKNPAIEWVNGGDTRINSFSTEEWAAIAPQWVNDLAVRFPDLNACVVAKPDEFIFIDCDTTREFIAGYEAFAGEKFPVTYTTSARDNRTQMHFRQTDASRALGNIPQFAVNGIDLSVRGKNEYVLAEGSLHPTGAVYQRVVDAGIVPMPDKLVEFIRQLKSVALTGKAAPSQTSSAPSDVEWVGAEQTLAAIPRNSNGKMTHGSYHGALLTLAGYWRAKGLDADAIEEKLTEYANLNFEPPIDFQKVSAMAKSVCASFPAGEDKSLVLTGSTARGAAAPTATTTSTSGMKIKRMSDYRSKKLYWLWQNRVPFGTLSTIAGDPDEGKSLITLYIAARVSRGEKLYDNPLETEPAEVLILSAEDDPETTLRPRLEAAGADLDKIHLLESVLLRDGTGKTINERIAQLDEDVKEIGEYLDQNPAIKLIVIDPISSFLGNANMNREQEVRRALQPLANRAKQTGLAVVMVAHFNKNSETRSAMDRVGGAKAIVGMGRAAWTCIREPEKEQQPGEPMPVHGDRRLFLKLKGNLAPSKIGGLVYAIKAKDVAVEDKDGKIVQVEQPYIVWLETTQDTAQDVVIGDKDGQPKKSKSKAAEIMLHEYLEKAGGWAESDKIKGALPFEGGTLQRARASLKLWVAWTTGADNRPVSVWGLPGVKKPKAHTVQVEAEVVGTGRKRRGKINLAAPDPVARPEEVPAVGVVPMSEAALPIEPW
jgi:hypothetical protein